LEDHQWKQATLPVSMGGLGKRSVETHAPGTYIASLGASSDIMEEVVGRNVEMEARNVEMEAKMARLVDLINTLSGEGELTPEAALASTQKMISHSIDQHTVVQLQDMLLDERDKARMNSVGMERAGALCVPWVSTSDPKSSLRQSSTGWESLCTIQPSTALPVAKTVTSTGTMPLAAARRGRGSTVYRHNVIRDTIHETAKQASLAPAKEQSAILPGSQAKPADVYIPGWANGRDAALDITVVSSLKQELKKRAAAAVGSAGQNADIDTR
jgi:hypothetical protein